MYFCEGTHGLSKVPKEGNSKTSAENKRVTWNLAFTQRLDSDGAHLFGSYLLARNPSEFSAILLV